MSASGHGLLLTVAGAIPWVPASGGVAVRTWTTSDYGRNWHRGAPLSLGHGTVTGQASFAYTGGSSGAAAWTGWMVITTATGTARVAAVTTGGSLRLLPGSLPAGNVQVLGGGAGFVWGGASLYRTTDNGRSWQHFSLRITIPPNSSMVQLLIDFSDTSHGWLVFGGTTWRTIDGGGAWTRG